jgi:hypothetical protein
MSAPTRRCSPPVRRGCGVEGRREGAVWGKRKAQLARLHCTYEALPRKGGCLARPDAYLRDVAVRRDKQLRLPAPAQTFSHAHVAHRCTTRHGPLYRVPYLLDGWRAPQYERQLRLTTPTTTPQGGGLVGGLAAGRLMSSGMFSMLLASSSTRCLDGCDHSFSGRIFTATMSPAIQSPWAAARLRLFSRGPGCQVARMELKKYGDRQD